MPPLHAGAGEALVGSEDSLEGVRGARRGALVWVQSLGQGAICALHSLRARVRRQPQRVRVRQRPQHARDLRLVCCTPCSLRTGCYRRLSSGSGHTLHGLWQTGRRSARALGLCSGAQSRTAEKPACRRRLRSRCTTSSAAARAFCCSPSAAALRSPTLRPSSSMRLRSFSVCEERVRMNREHARVNSAPRAASRAALVRVRPPQQLA